MLNKQRKGGSRGRKLKWNGSICAWAEESGRT